MKIIEQNIENYKQDLKITINCKCNQVFNEKQKNNNKQTRKSIIILKIFKTNQNCFVLASYLI